jgi:hypothetical protein
VRLTVVCIYYSIHMLFVFVSRIFPTLFLNTCAHIVVCCVIAMVSMCCCPTKGVVGMQTGGERSIVIPPTLGYGNKAHGSKIPPNATLRFLVTLIGYY